MVIESTKHNQCKNTDPAIDCLKKIEDKEERCFILFNIERFCSSISPDLFNQSINFAKFLHNI